MNFPNEKSTPFERGFLRVILLLKLNQLLLSLINAFIFGPITSLKRRPLKIP